MRSIFGLTHNFFVSHLCGTDSTAISWGLTCSRAGAANTGGAGLGNPRMDDGKSSAASLNKSNVTKLICWCKDKLLHNRNPM